MSVEALSAIASAVTAVATLGAVVLAFGGLRTWRRELQGRTEYDLARRILVAVYRVRRGIINVRSPLMTAAEWIDRPDRSATAVLPTHDDTVFAYQNRWDAISESGSQLDVELLEAEALWGDELKNEWSALRACIMKLMINLRNHLHSPRDGRSRQTESIEEFQSIQAIVYQSGNEPLDDPFGREVATAIKAFENKLRPHLGRKRRP